jgi:hypothetical protein
MLLFSISIKREILLLLRMSQIWRVGRNKKNLASLQYPVELIENRDTRGVRTRVNGSLIFPMDQITKGEKPL